MRHVPAIGLVMAVMAGLAGCVPRPVGLAEVPPATTEAVVPPAQVAAGEALFPVPLGALFGYVSPTGEVVIEPRFEAAAPFSEGLARVRAEGAWGYLRPDGQYAITPQFVDAADFRAGRARVVLSEAGAAIGSRQARAEDRRFATYIDPLGRPITGANLSEARDFARVGDRALAPVERMSVFRLVPLGLDFLSFLSPALQTQREWVVLGADGEVVFEVPFAGRIQIYSDGLAAFEERPGLIPRALRWGYVDGEGQVAIEPAFETATPFSEGLAAVGSRGRIGYVNREGAWVVQPRFEEAGPFREGYARVRLDGLWGFIDAAGAFVIEPAYETAGNFSQGLAVVGRGGRFGYVRPGGALALPMVYTLAGPFRNGLAYVRADAREGYVTPTGDFVWADRP